MPSDAPARHGPERHGWVKLGEGWEAHLRSPLSVEERAEVEDWRQRGLPLVVARRQPADGADDLRLGLATPDKRRIGVHAATAAALDQTGPLPLADSVPSAPEAWRARLGAVVRLADIVGTQAHVFGSLAWQHLSGLSYVRAGSDVDLLFAPRRWPVVEGLLAVLADLDGFHPPEGPRLDGEILLPDGGAVAWRELAARPAKLLVKGPADVTLRNYAQITALFDECHPE
ncbi:malonate decarboxylase holo-[acyl-carrier-protein] synthase [Azospirillum sp. sgz302134]